MFQVMQVHQKKQQELELSDVVNSVSHFLLPLLWPTPMLGTIQLVSLLVDRLLWLQECSYLCCQVSVLEKSI